MLALARKGRVVGDPSAVDLAALVERSWENVRTEDATLTVERPLDTVEAHGWPIEL